MPRVCRTIVLDDGTTARVQVDARYCESNGCSRYSEILCDFPLANGRTCDRRQCRRCASAIAHEVDWCRAHARWWEAVSAMLGVGAFTVESVARG